MLDLSLALSQLRQERSRIQKELGRLSKAITSLEKLAGGDSSSVPAPRTRARRKLSAAARRRISEAQKARWAKVKKQKAAA